jgi:tetratricopeptide (TPR) repeat protein
VTRQRRPRSRPTPSQPSPKSEPRALAVIPGGRPATPSRVRRARSTAEQVSKAYVAVAPEVISDYQPHKTAFFNTLKNAKAMTHVGGAVAVRPNATLAEQRGYRREDLYAIAEIGHNYLFNGGLDLALSLFEGLVAIEPNEAYFALALGLTHDRLGEPQEAYRWYQQASKLDPSDARPDVNRAELEIEAGRHDRALQLLQRGAAKARAAGDEALERKATAIFNHIRKTTKRRPAMAARTTRS